MTETGSTLERLREQVGPEKFNCFLGYEQVFTCNCDDPGEDCPYYWGSSNVKIEALQEALAALHSQASDEGKQ